MGNEELFRDEPVASPKVLLCGKGLGLNEFHFFRIESHFENLLLYFSTIFIELKTL